MKTRHYITYFRVSTTLQGRSGLGLEAQQQAVNVFLHGDGELILESFTEIESGRKNDRPQLDAALDACRKHKAVLLIAKLDRLARNVHFISGLRNRVWNSSPWTCRRPTGSPSTSSPPWPSTSAR